MINPLDGWRFVGGDDVADGAHDAHDAHDAPAVPIPPAPAGPPAPARRRFVLKFSDGRTMTLELIWDTYRAWRKRPEAAAGSPWGTWRIGDHVVAYKLDG